MSIRRLASLAVAAVVAVVIVGGFGSGGPAPVRADDSACANKPTDCVTMRVNVTGYLDGHGFDQSGAFNCTHSAGSTTSSCTWAFYLVASTRVVTMNVQADNPAGAEVCISTTCGPSPQNKDITLTKGAKGPTVSMSINPVNGKTVTVSKGGTGSGTVTSDKGGINCGSSCTWIYADSTLVILTATPTGGSTFSGWSDGGTCQGQDATCHLLTGVNITTQANFTAPATPPPSSPATPTPSRTPAPTASPNASAAASPGHTASASRPPTTAPGTPGPGASTDPDATPISGDPGASGEQTTDPAGALTPTPFTFATDDPNRTDVPLGAQPTAQPTQPASDAGSGPSFIVIGLILVLGVLVGGGVFWWARRRGPTPG
jgi:hypothetical protein